jgi:predicted HAD superfamily phosphohydrolase YqeG
VDIDNTLLTGPRSPAEPSQQRWLDRSPEPMTMVSHMSATAK